MILSNTTTTQSRVLYNTKLTQTLDYYKTEDLLQTFKGQIRDSNNKLPISPMALGNSLFPFRKVTCSEILTTWHKLPAVNVFIKK